ncbi:MAG: ABC transporter ATP-binding protein [Spirochaetaceae bacterium]|nr:ABC transporter ATP-binding protein [Spirochaetaceae bacterium]
MIELNALSKTYAKSERKAVDTLSLTVPDGIIFGFLGPNGAGKTTTIKMACGALEPDQGMVKIDGISMHDSPMEAKSQIGFVNDNPEMFNRLKAREYIDFVADIYRVPSDERKARIESLAEAFEIADVLSNPIGSLSRGMKQKVSIISSLVHDPHDWILDEPMVGLDPEASFHVKEIMRERTRAEKCVFFSTHVMEVAEKICDRLAIISKGRILFTGTLDDLRSLRNGKSSDDSLEQLFLELVDSDDSQK